MDNLLNEAETSEYLGGIPRAQLKQWRHLGRGPAFIRLGRAVRYRRSDLDAFVAAGRVEPGEAPAPAVDRYAKLRSPRRAS